MSRRFEDFWESNGLVPSLARQTLLPLSLVFGAAARLRSAVYTRGLAETAQAPIPVVSVGNLRVGGSGKTPLVLWLVERIAAAGRRPAVITRGYGGTQSALPSVVVAGELALAAERAVAPDLATIVRLDDARRVPRGLADEAAMLALRTCARVVVSPNRLRGCEIAARLGADVALLDDGFQHRRLRRDLDIVLTCAGDASARLLPAGPLREGLGALARADVVIATDDDAPTGGRPAFRMRQRAAGFVREVSRDAEVTPLTSLSGQSVVAVAGIARPERFLAQLSSAGVKLACVPYLFGDHRAYSPSDVAAIAAAARGGRTVVTTEKDLVKLASAAGGALSLVALRIEPEIDRGDALVERVLGAASSLDASRRGPHHPPLSPAGAGSGT